MVMPFAWLELLAVGAAMLVYARHAPDGESIALCNDCLIVEQANGGQVRRVEFRSGWVSVEATACDGSLVERTSKAAGDGGAASAPRVAPLVGG